MPEYLAPGVYIEETSYRSKSIEGVSTSTAGFVGPARFGPTMGTPEVLTSFADFERIYGSADQLAFDGGSPVHNYVAHGVRGFFDEGGARIYIARAFEPKDGDTNLGVAQGAVPGADPKSPTLALSARYPGAMGNFRVAFTLRLGQNCLGNDGGVPVLKGAGNNDVVWQIPLKDDGSASGPGAAFRLERKGDTFLMHPAAGGDAVAVSALAGKFSMHVVSCIITVSFIGASGKPTAEQQWGGLGLDDRSDAALIKAFARYPASKAIALYVPLVIDNPSSLDGGAILTAMLAQSNAAGKKLGDVIAPTATAADLSFAVSLSGGNDGKRPPAKAYGGAESADMHTKGWKSGLMALEDVDDISIIAAPGSTFNYADSAWAPEADTITRQLIGQCERLKYRVAVLDSADNHVVSEVRAYRAQLDSTYGALYYPWLRIMDPVTNAVINVPPSGIVAGIYARNDNSVGVHKAPANEPVRSAIGLQLLLNKGQQDVLNPEGINCFRFFEGRGNRLWGARTISSDPEWKYVNLRRYFAYLEHSLDKGTQWAVFMNNDDSLWANVRSTIGDFLFTEWKNGHLMGTTPDQAYFVRCDRSTMTQNDLDNGRLVCLIGVSPVRPAEYVIFRIGQWTASK